MLSRTFKDISLDTTPHPITGDLITLNNTNAIRKSVVNLVLTIPGERPYQEQIGSSVNRRLFDTFDFSTASVIKDEIRQTIEINEPRVRIDDLEVEPNYQQYRYDIYIRFTVIGTNIEIDLNTYLQNSKD